MKTTTKKRRPSYESLARELGFSGNSVRTWASRPGAPRGFNVGRWRAFITENGLGVAANRISPQRAAVLAELLRRKIRLAELEIARKEARTVVRSDMDALHHEVARRQMAVLTAALVDEYPGRVVGRTSAEVRIIGREFVDRICTVFSQDLPQWEWAEPGC